MFCVSPVFCERKMHLLNLEDSDSFNGDFIRVSKVIINICAIFAFMIPQHEIANFYWFIYLIGTFTKCPHMIGCRFLINPIILCVLIKMHWICSSKLNFGSKNKPRGFWSLTWWTGFSSCLHGSRLKFIFHCNANSEIFVRSLFRLTVLLVITCTVENKEVLSAKIFALDCKLFGKWFMSIKNNKGPKIDPCWTSAFTFVHDQNWPFKTTLCWRFFKKYIKRHSSLSFILFCFNLYISPSCDTFSKALDIPRNTPLTPKPLSKEVKISWVIDRSFMEEPPGLNTVLEKLEYCIRSILTLWYVRKSCYRLEEERLDDSFWCFICRLF